MEQRRADSFPDSFLRNFVAGNLDGATLSAKAIVEERLGKQLGRGTGDAEKAGKSLLKNPLSFIQFLRARLVFCKISDMASLLARLMFSICSLDFAFQLQTWNEKGFPPFRY